MPFVCSALWCSNPGEVKYSILRHRYLRDVVYAFDEIIGEDPTIKSILVILISCRVLVAARLPEDFSAEI